MKIVKPKSLAPTKLEVLEPCRRALIKPYQNYIHVIDSRPADETVVLDAIFDMGLGIEKSSQKISFGWTMYLLATEWAIRHDDLFRYAYDVWTHKAWIPYLSKEYGKPERWNIADLRSWMKRYLAKELGAKPGRGHFWIWAPKHPPDPKPAMKKGQQEIDGVLANPDPNWAAILHRLERMESLLAEVDKRMVSIQSDIELALGTISKNDNGSGRFYATLEGNPQVDK
jgi:hypothetical protein